MQFFPAGKTSPITFAWPEPATRWQQSCIARAGDLAQWPAFPTLASPCSFYLIDEVSTLDEHQETLAHSLG